MIYFATQVRYNRSRAPWQIERCFNKLRDAKEYVERKKDSQPHAKHRIVRLKREKIYE